MKWISSIVAAASLLQVAPVLCDAEDDVIWRYARAGMGTEVTPKDSRRGVMAAQLVVGTLVGAAAGGAAILATAGAAGGCFDDGCEEPNLPILVLGALATPVALAFANSGTVYAIGRAVDGEEHGSFAAMLPKALAGAVVGAGVMIMAGPQAIEEPASLLLWWWGFAAPTVGAIAGYELSRPGRSASAAQNGAALVSIEDRRVRWGVPTPSIRVATLPNHQSSISYSVNLMNVTF